MISLTSPVKTIAHSWPAGVKFSGLCLATVTLFHLQNIIPHLGILCAVFVIYALNGRIFLYAGLRSLRLLLPFIILLSIWHLATGNLYEGTVIVLRMINALALANWVTMVTPLQDLMALLNWITTPLRLLNISTKPLEISVALVVRFIPVLYIKASRLKDAWLARSAKKPYWRLIVPITILALDDADHLADALKARGGLVQKKEK